MNEKNNNIHNLDVYREDGKNGEIIEHRVQRLKNYNIVQKVVFYPKVCYRVGNAPIITECYLHPYLRKKCALIYLFRKDKEKFTE